MPKLTREGVTEFWNFSGVGGEQQHGAACHNGAVTHCQILTFFNKSKMLLKLNFDITINSFESEHTSVCLTKCFGAVYTTPL